MTPGDATITYLGHSTLLIEAGGVRILTDPILRDRVGPLVRVHPVPASIDLDAVDAVLLSHSHWDHLDTGSLRLLGSDVPLLVPAGLGRRLRSRGFRAVEELVPGERTVVGTVGVTATHASHRGFGRPISPDGLAIGFLLDAGRRLYFPGDTALFEGMRDLADGLDVALMPVWGWGPRAREDEHLDPLGAARALQLLAPRHAIPIHWGTLHPVGFRWLRPSTRVDPPHQFARLAATLAPATSVRILGVGESMTIAAADG